jgi:hypothetical protein
MASRARNRSDMNNRFPKIASSSRAPTFALALALVIGLAIGGHGVARAASDLIAPASSAAMPAALGDPVQHEAPPRDAFVECESAVSRSLREIRGSTVQALQFAADGRTANADGDHLDVKGSGRYRRGAGAPIEFRYSCAYDSAHGTASGVVLHEADGRADAALPVWQADLSKISPEACESAVADRLQSTHSRASGIVFDGGSRKLEPASDGRTALAGTGRVVRAPGMQPGPFRYRCEFDAGGHLAGASATD